MPHAAAARQRIRSAQHGDRARDDAPRPEGEASRDCRRGPRADLPAAGPDRGGAPLLVGRSQPMKSQAVLDGPSAPIVALADDLSAGPAAAKTQSEAATSALERARAF